MTGVETTALTKRKLLASAADVKRVSETLPLADAPSLTIKQFCEFEGISRTSFFKMQRNGTAPETLRVPGVAIVRITAAARRDWHARMAALKDHAAIESKKKERVAISSRAGKIGSARRKSPRRKRRA